MNQKQTSQSGDHTRSFQLPPLIPDAQLRTEEAYSNYVLYNCENRFIVLPALSPSQSLNRDVLLLSIGCLTSRFRLRLGESRMDRISQYNFIALTFNFNASIHSWIINVSQPTSCNLNMQGVLIPLLYCYVYSDSASTLHYPQD